MLREMKHCTNNQLQTHSHAAKSFHFSIQVPLVTTKYIRLVMTRDHTNNAYDSISISAVKKIKVYQYSC